MKKNLKVVFLPQLYNSPIAVIPAKAGIQI
jgi:hypothetical protein